MSLVGTVLALTALAGPAALIPQAEQDRLVRDLVEQISHPSNRGTDLVIDTDADVASRLLSKIGEPAVPALLGALNSPVGWSKVHAMEVLAGFKDRRAVAPTLKILRSDPEMGVRGVAADNLGAYGDPSAIPDLLNAARSNDDQIADGAWFSLGELKATAAVPILAAHLNHRVIAIPGGHVPDLTPVNALVKIGTPAVPALVSVLSSGDPASKMGAGQALGQIATPAAMAALRSAYANPTSQRAAIAGLLESSSPDEAHVAAKALVVQELSYDAESYFERCPSPKCLEALKSEIPGLRKSVDCRWDVLPVEVALIRRFRDRSSVPLLLYLLQNGLEEEKTIPALAEFQVRSAIPLLVKVALKWRSGDSGSPEAAGDALSKFGGEAVDALMDAFRRRPKDAYAIGHALGKFEDPSAGPALMRALAHGPTAQLRIGAIQSLGNMRFEKASEVVEKAMRDPTADVRVAAVFALALMGDVRAISPLSQFAQKGAFDLGDEWTAEGAKALPMLKFFMGSNDFSAEQAVAALHTPETTKLLVAGMRSRNPRFAAKCAEALGERRATDAVGPLLAALAGEGIELRFQAYMALRKLSASH